MKTKIEKYGPLELKPKTFEELQVATKTWLSELEFINYEVQFLKHLLGEKYIDCLEAGLHERIKEFTKEIFNKKDAVKKLKELVFEHEKLVANLIDREDVGTDIFFLQTHNKLALEINKFISNYKYIKMQVFEIVESVLAKKGQKKLT